MDIRTNDKRGFAFILMAAMLWGTAGTAMTLAPQEAQPLAIGALRMLVGGVTLMGIFIFGPNRSCPLPKYRLPMGLTLLAAACMAAFQVLFFAGVEKTGVVVGTMVGIGSSPVLAGALGWLFRKERPQMTWLGTTMLAIAGCSLLVYSGQVQSAAQLYIDPVGLLLAAGAGAAYAAFSLVSNELLARQPVEKVMTAVFSIGGLLLSPLLLMQNLVWLAQPGGIAVVLYLGLLATALAYALFGWGLQQVPTTSAASLKLAEPLTAVILGMSLLGEQLTLPAWIGIVLIFCGLALISLKRSKFLRGGQPLRVTE